MCAICGCVRRSVRARTVFVLIIFLRVYLFVCLCVCVGACVRVLGAFVHTCKYEMSSFVPCLYVSVRGAYAFVCVGNEAHIYTTMIFFIDNPMYVQLT